MAGSRGDRSAEMTRGRLAMLGGVAAISFAAIFFRQAAPTHPLVSAALRLAVAALVLLPWVLRARARGRLSLVLMRAGAVAGVFYALHFGFWVTSLTMTTVAASVTLVTATPLLLAVVGWVQGRDKATPRQWIAIAIALVGLSMIGFQDLFTSGAIIGDLLAFAGAASMAGYLLVVRRLGPVDAWAFLGVACAVGAVLLLAVAALGGITIDVPSSEAGLYILLAALVPQLIGHGLLTWSLRVMSPTSVGLATVAEPVLSTGLAWLWLREQPAALTIVGCALTLGAVLLSLFFAKP